MHLRHDAAPVSGEIIALVHRLAQDRRPSEGHGRPHRALSESRDVIAERAVLTIDLRNTDQSQLEAVEREG